MFIQTEDTPNPATQKFIPGRPVMETGTANFPTLESAKNTPLARNLFAIKGIKGVFFGSDFVSVTKSDDIEWFVIKPLILEGLTTYFMTHDKVKVLQLSEADRSPAASSSDNDEIAAEIQELIESRIRPAVAQDGGDIIFDRFENGIVYLAMQGACSGCPSSSATLKSGIENMLRYYIPEVTEVRAIE
ncbi:MAG: NifU family protein [Alphaproteobacteria bacterium]|nr:NifU family protein [Alphaproteobacteria bacterium]